MTSLNLSTPSIEAFQLGVVTSDYYLRHRLHNLNHILATGDKHGHNILYILQVIRLGMYEVHCDELIRKLAQRAEEIATRLLGRMTENHTKANKE